MDMDVKSFYEEYWEWREKVGHLAQNWIPYRLKVVASMIQEKHHLRVLDVGCGEGGLGMLLREKYNGKINLVGIDISKKVLEIASPYYDETICMNVEVEDISEKLKNRKFDYTVIVEVLEHLFRPEIVLKQLKNLLKRDGCMLVSFPNFAFWKNRISLLRGKFPSDAHLYNSSEHLHYWTFYSFKNFLTENGFQIEQIGGEFKLPFQSFLPESIRKRFGKKFPNLFGYQIVMKCKPR